MVFKETWPHPLGAQSVHTVAGSIRHYLIVLADLPTTTTTAGPPGANQWSSLPLQ